MLVHVLGTLQVHMHGAFYVAVRLMHERELTVKWTCMATTSAAASPTALQLQQVRWLP